MTLSVACTVCVFVPLFPRIVIVNVPVLAVRVVRTVSVVVPLGVTGFGAYVPVAPLPSPETDIVTGAALPATWVTVTVYVVWLPRFTVLVLGETERAKSGCVDTTSVAATE